MALVVEFTCELPNGVHARPASHVETLCNTFISQIEWHNLRTDRKGDAKSGPARTVTSGCRVRCRCIPEWRETASGSGVSAIPATDPAPCRGN